MLRHLNRKKDKLKQIDPKHVAFWEELFAMPFSTLLEHEPGKVSGISTLGRDSSVLAALTLMIQNGHDTKERHNTCVLEKNLSTRTSISLSRRPDMITAFYFPLTPDLIEVRLIIGGNRIASWTPEGSNFRCPPLPLSMILQECRSLPALHVDWVRILAMAREQGDYSRYDHDFGRDVEIGGVSYRRAVLVHPCIAMAGLTMADVHLRFIFQEDESQEFTFYSETWILGIEGRRFIAQTAFEMESQSDTFEDDTNEQALLHGMMGTRFIKDSQISTVGALLKYSVAMTRANSALAAIGKSSINL